MYQKRYIAYAKVHGRTPAEQLRHDKSASHGGCMVGYIIWIGEQIARFREVHPSAFIGARLADQDAFDRFLEGEK